MRFGTVFAVVPEVLCIHQTSPVVANEDDMRPTVAAAALAGMFEPWVLAVLRTSGGRACGVDRRAGRTGWSRSSCRRRRRSGNFGCRCMAGRCGQSVDRRHAMGKGRRSRAGRASGRTAPAAGPADWVSWEETAALLPPRPGQGPPSTAPTRSPTSRPAAPSAMNAPTPARRPRRTRECVELTRLAAERDQLRDRLAAAEATIVGQVRRERRAGASWGDVGRVLGMTRQGARQRYGPE